MQSGLQCLQQSSHFLRSLAAGKKALVTFLCGFMLKFLGHLEILAFGFLEKPPSDINMNILIPIAYSQWFNCLMYKLTEKWREKAVT